MNYKIAFLLSFIGFCGFHHIAAQDRTPLYLHGLGGNSTNWAGWRTMFYNERKMALGDNRDYVSTTGIANYVGQVPTHPNNRTLVFGHSTGGVVARHLERTRANFVGIITAGAPLDGAKIGNNLRDGQVTNFIVDGIDKVLKGAIRELPPPAAQIFEIEGHKFRDFAEADVNRILEKNNILPVNQSVIDLAENSDYMTSSIRTASSWMPKIHIYGNENSPVLYRIASVAAGSPDNYFASLSQKAYDLCIVKKNHWTALGFGTGIPAYFHIADGWNTSANWIKNGSETGWHNLIGASIPESKTFVSTVTDWAGVNQCLSQYPQATYQQYMQCQQQYTQTVTTIAYSPVNGISDAFIKAPSQTGYKSAWSDNATKIQALGVNHLEMKDHSAMKTIYNNIFDGSVPGMDPIFITPIR